LILERPTRQLTGMIALVTSSSRMWMRRTDSPGVWLLLVVVSRSAVLCVLVTLLMMLFCCLATGAVSLKGLPGPATRWRGGQLGNLIARHGRGADQLHRGRRGGRGSPWTARPYRTPVARTLVPSDVARNHCVHRGRRSGRVIHNT
jgi:hypothetical protein